MEELRREREVAQAAEGELKSDPYRARNVRWPPSEVGGRAGRVSQSGLGRS